jgi:hypothetical protein
MFICLLYRSPSSARHIVVPCFIICLPQKVLASTAPDSGSSSITAAYGGNDRLRSDGHVSAIACGQYQHRPGENSKSLHMTQCEAQKTKRKRTDVE